MSSKTFATIILPGEPEDTFPIEEEFAAVPKIGSSVKALDRYGRVRSLLVSMVSFPAGNCSTGEEARHVRLICRPN